MHITRKLLLTVSSLLIAWTLFAITSIDSGGWIEPARVAAQEPEQAFTLVDISKLARTQKPAAPSGCTDPGEWLNELLWSTKEPNNSPGTAVQVIDTGRWPDHPAPAPYRGNLTPSGDWDWFELQVPDPARLFAATSTIGSEGCGKDSVIKVYASNGTNLLEQDNNGGSMAGNTASSIGGTSMANPGSYYLQVLGVGGTQIQPYHLYMDLKTGAPPAEVEPNNNPTSAQPLPSSSWVRGTVNATDADFYRFTVVAGATIYVGLDMDPDRVGQNVFGRAGLGLFSGGNILLANDTDGEKPYSQAFLMTVGKTGDYWAYVDAPDATMDTDYVLNVRTYPNTTPYLSCNTHSSINVPKTFGDSGTTSTLIVPSNAKIADLDLSIQTGASATTTYDINLKSPDGTTAAVDYEINHTEALSGTLKSLKYDDEAATPPIDPFYDGIVFQPEPQNRLSAFDGKNAQGTWVLTIDPVGTGNSGVLGAWSLNVCEGVKPGKATLLAPADDATQRKRKVKFDWADAPIADWYQLIVRQDSKKGPTVLKVNHIEDSEFAKKLPKGHEYFWFVKSWNDYGKVKSQKFNFEIKP